MGLRTTLDIPDASILTSVTLGDLVNDFARKTKHGIPDVFALPLYDEGGPHMPGYDIREYQLWSSFALDQAVVEIRESYPEAKVYLTLMPELPGLKAGNLTRRTQFGNEVSSSTCITNPATQDIVVQFALEAIERYRPDGVVFDIVEIQGQTGREEVVEVTCFCEHCREALIKERFNQSERFRSIENPLNLVLTSTGTGVRFITPKTTHTPEQLVEQALVRGNIKQKEDYHIEWAEIVLDYIRKRSTVTGKAIGTLSRRIKEAYPDIRTAAILCNSNFDWTTGMGIEATENQVDEVWLDIDDMDEFKAPANTEVHMYLADRSRYYIDAYFEIVSDYQYIRSMIERGSVRELYQTISSKADVAIRVQNLNTFIVMSAGSHNFLRGIVGSPISSKVLKQVEKDLRPEIDEIVQRGLVARPSSDTITKEELLSYLRNLVMYVAQQDGQINPVEVLQIAARTGIAETRELNQLLDDLRG